MGQILHGSAKTTHAVRAAIQRSKASIQELASRYDLNRKTVMKWRKRAFLYDAPMGPKVPQLISLTRWLANYAVDSVMTPQRVAASGAPAAKRAMQRVERAISCRRECRVGGYDAVSIESDLSCLVSLGGGNTERT
jgi:transposase-like protein